MCEHDLTNRHALLPSSAERWSRAFRRKHTMFERRDANAGAVGAGSLTNNAPAGAAPAAEVPAGTPAPTATPTPGASASGDVYGAADAKAVEDNWTQHGGESE